jgi:hypothetical protein
MVPATTDSPRVRTPRRCAAGPCDPSAVRHSEFWELMAAEFGEAYARTLARELVMSSLGERTAQQALAGAEDARTVWFAVCDAMDVPQERRWGRDEPHRRAR